MTTQIQFLNNAKRIKREPGSLFNFASRLDFSVIVNTHTEKIEKGVLVTMDGNFASYSTITYYGGSNVLRYKTRFYNNGSSLVLLHAADWYMCSIVNKGIKRTLSQCGALDELMHFVFNMDNIKKECTNEKQTRKTMKYLRTMVMYYLPSSLQAKAIQWVECNLQ